MKNIESSILKNELRDFQQETVKRVMNQFQTRNKILVSDEVGLGKTRIAKGVIAQMALNTIKTGTLKVVYICYNESIAAQNLKVLKNIDELNVISPYRLPNLYIDKRLSTFHFILFLENVSIAKEINNNDKVNASITYLTPATSFNSSLRGQGTKTERALMYAHLRNIDSLKKYIIGSDKYGTDSRLAKLFIGKAENSWNYDVNAICDAIDYNNKEEIYAYKVKEYVSEIKLKLLNLLIEDLDVEKLTKDSSLIEYIKNNFSGESVLDFIIEICNNTIDLSKVNSLLIKKLKIIFSNISLEKCQPDLIIMDEFQRYEDIFNKSNKFQELDKEEKDSIDEMDYIVDRFFNGENYNSLKEQPKMLLLSATPYRLYSTTSDIIKYGTSISQYKGFETIMSYLFESQKNVKEWEEFKKIWHDYQDLLEGKISVIDEKAKKLKQDYENMIYRVMCRTERKDRNNLIKDNGNIDILAYDYEKSLKEDIKSYKAMRTLLEKNNSQLNISIDYVKSSPYLLSFMYDYFKVKQELKGKKIDSKAMKNLFIDEEDINNYVNIDSKNFRLEYLKKLIFQKDNIENLLWIPPTIPYYQFGGAYKNLETSNISKVIVFSKWKFVPRMLSALLSYEAERRATIKYVYRGKKKLAIEYKKPEGNNFKYGYNYSNNIILLYPSKFLKKCYSPIEIYNQYKGKICINDLKEIIKTNIKKKLIEEDKFDLLTKVKNNYLLVLLLDDDRYVSNWLKRCKDYYSGEKVEIDSEIDTSEDNSTSFGDYINKYLYKIYFGGEVFLNKKNGKENVKIFPGVNNKKWKTYPELNISNKEIEAKLELLADLAIASPAICISRAYDLYDKNGLNYDILYPTEVASKILPKFDTRTSHGIIYSMEYKENKNNPNYFWRRVLKYCIDGNFQSMIDEYIHLFGYDKIQDIHPALVSSLNIKSNVTKKIDTKDDTDLSIRTNFALNFSTDDEKNALRNNSVRDAFNSPFRPFVFATTSLGQEGLDFHNYCRKIVHWNLPSNPVDLEQREGRIYRYKCLAIRQNMKTMFENYNYKDNIWEETFNIIREENRSNPSNINTNSPDFNTYWCSKTNDVKIERIIPSYPLSNDINNYEHLKEILNKYRITIGQLKQEDLSEYYKNIDNIEELFINLSPYDKK